MYLTEGQGGKDYEGKLDANDEPANLYDDICR